MATEDSPQLLSQLLSLLFLQTREGKGRGSESTGLSSVELYCWVVGLALAGVLWIVCYCFCVLEGLGRGGAWSWCLLEYEVYTD